MGGKTEPNGLLFHTKTALLHPPNLVRLADFNDLGKNRPFPILFVFHLVNQQVIPVLCLGTTGKGDDVSEEQPEDGWFREYLRKCQARDTPTGDFVTDSRNVPDFPRVETLEELLSFVRARGGHPDSVVAAKRCWRNYVLWLRNKDFYAYLKIKDRKAWESVPPELREKRW